MGHNMYAQTRGLVTCGAFVRGFISPIFGMSTHLTFQLTDCVQTLIEVFYISHLLGTGRYVKIYPLFQRQINMNQMQIELVSKRYGIW